MWVMEPQNCHLCIQKGAKGKLVPCFALYRWGNHITKLIWPLNAFWGVYGWGWRSDTDWMRILSCLVTSSKCFWHPPAVAPLSFFMARRWARFEGEKAMSPITIAPTDHLNANTCQDSWVDTNVGIQMISVNWQGSSGDMGSQNGHLGVQKQERNR